MRISKLITISLHPKLLAEVEQIAKEECRSRSELIREAIRRYIEEKKAAKIYREESTIPF